MQICKSCHSLAFLTATASAHWHLEEQIQEELNNPSVQQNTSSSFWSDATEIIRAVRPKSGFSDSNNSNASEEADNNPENETG